MPEDGAWDTDDWVKFLKEQAGYTREYRHNLYEKVDVQSKMNILDVGCGTGAITADIASLAKGAVFGEMSLIDGSPRSASIIANEDAILLVLTKDKFFYLMDHAPRLGLKLVLKIAKSLSLRLRQTSGVLIDYLEK